MISVVLLSILFYLVLLVSAFIIMENTYCKFMIAGAINNACILIVALLAIFKGQNFYLDIAIVYALLSFISMQGLLRYSS
jgi:multisubunit Na+/H+ antiporter MnhF subunit